MSKKVEKVVFQYRKMLVVKTKNVEKNEKY